MPLQPGDTVYMLSDLGDVNPETKQRVVARAGMKGIIRGEYYEDGTVKVRVDVPDSPGQKSLCCRAVDFHNLWSDLPPKPLLTRFERIIEEDAA